MRNDLRITIELVARKLIEVRQRTNEQLSEQFEKYSRLAEVTVFVEWRCGRPGGLRSLLEGLVTFAEGRILPKEFYRIEADEHGRFSPADALRVWANLPSLAKKVLACPLEFVEMFEPADISCEQAATDGGISPAQLERFRGWLTRTEVIEACSKCCINQIERLILDFFSNPQGLFPESATKPYSLSERLSCESARAAELRQMLVDGTIRESTVNRPKPAWLLMAGLPQIFSEFIDAEAEREKAAVAATKIAQLVFDACEYALGTNSAVPLEGCSSYGKTTALQAFCRAYPGRARFVATPSPENEKELLIAIAAALGIDTNCSCSAVKITEQIRFVLTGVSLLFVFDDSHYLFPQKLTRATRPWRLNFLRTEIIQRKQPCIFSATTENGQKAQHDFIAKTGYPMEQWLGCLDIAIKLPEDFSAEDMLLIAKLHFPHVTESALSRMVAKARQAQLPMPALKIIGNRAAWHAKKAGRDAVELTHMMMACEEFEGRTIKPALEKGKTAAPRVGRIVEPVKSTDRNIQPVSTVQPEIFL